MPAGKQFYWCELRDAQESRGLGDVYKRQVFQLGKSGVSKFRNMWKALQESNFIGASYEMLDSKWNKQTPNRCKKLADQMKSCD